MEVTKVRVFRTNQPTYKFGVRQPGCTHKDMAGCPANHLCWDYEHYPLAMVHAFWLARSLEEQAARRRARERERIHNERMDWLNAMTPWQRAQLGKQSDYALAAGIKP